MKSLAPALLGLCCTLAQAQGSVTVSGMLGAGLRQSSNIDPSGASRLELTGTNLGAGALALRGAEDLGGGVQLRFRLESGFFPDTGTLRHNNTLFGREASVGISAPWGRLDAGRLQVTGNASEALVRADPARGAGQLETTWPGIWTGARYNNALRYRRDFGPVFVGAQAALGEQDGARGRVLDASAGYASDTLMLIGVWQAARDAGGLRAVTATVGATWTVKGITLHGALMHARRERGFVVGAAAGTALYNSELGLAGIAAPADQDNRFALLGVTLPLAPRWSLRSALFYAHSPHATLLSASRGGVQRSGYAILAYELSKRSSVLLSVDANAWRGGWGGFWGASPASLAAYRPDGRDTRRSAQLGMLHLF
jgi:predicted porin